MRTGLMTAMPEEGAALLAEARGGGEGAERVRIAGREFVSCTLWGREVVQVQTRIGKVAAASTATELVSRFGVDRLVMTGLAGGLDPDVRIGDVVVADRLVQHDLDASPIFPAMEIPLLGVTEIETDPGLTRVLADAAEAFLREDLAADLGQKLRERMHVRDPAVRTGLIATGDRFVSTDLERDALRARVPDALCVEMEGAAAAQVAHEHGVPIGVVRAISDAADDHAASNFPDSLGTMAAAYAHGVVKRWLEGNAK